MLYQTAFNSTAAFDTCVDADGFVAYRNFFLTFQIFRAGPNFAHMCAGRFVARWPTCKLKKSFSGKIVEKLIFTAAE